jgi:SAM-dependent methyltransferase
MERYFSARQVARIAIGQKYKKTSYGGRKFFVKMSLPSAEKKQVIVEFFNKNQGWKLEPLERKRAISKGVEKSSIRAAIAELNSHSLKKPVSPDLTAAQYVELYRNQPDIDRLGYYEKNSPEYVRVKNILSSVGNGALVYDAGCNSGGIGRILIKERGCRMFGSEINRELARLARKKGTKAYCGWAEQVPFKDDSFDHVILDFILEHVIDPEKIMQESLRLLKPGGFVVGHVPTEFGDWGKHTIGKHPEHLRAYDEPGLKRLLKRYRLTSITITKEKLVGRRVADYYFFTAKK